MTDDRLALCLSYLSKGSTWKALEERLGQRTIRIYGLEAKRLRLDATVGKVGHAPGKHTLFKVGKAKKGGYEVQFKLSLASIDPLGLPIVCDVAPGNRADDPLYIPSYQRAKKVLDNRGLLMVGDSKMNGQRTLAIIVLGGDYYLTPLSPTKDEPGLLDDLIAPWREREQEAMRIFPRGDIASDGEEPDLESAIAHGFESQRERTVLVDGKLVVWTERLLVVRSYSYQKTEQAALQERLDKAEKALKALTPPRGRGQKQIEKEAALLKAIRQIEKQYSVQGLFDLSYVREMEERHVRGYRGQSARIERKVRYQLSVARNEEAIAAAEFRAGWRISVTNAPPEELSLTDGVLAYRDQIIAENVFRRLHGKVLSITPLYVQRDDHAKGLFHLLTIGARFLALGDYLAKEALATQKSELTGIYRGNPKRGTARPTTERMLKAFAEINLIIFSTNAQSSPCYLTALSPVQKRILTLLRLPLSLYTDLQTA